METIYLEDNFFPVVKMERLLDADAECVDDAKPTADRTKVGEIFQTSRDHLAFVCVHCSAEFSLFVQFATHIEKHLHDMYLDAIDEPPMTACPNEPTADHIDVKPMITDNSDVYCDDPAARLNEVVSTEREVDASIDGGSDILVKYEDNKQSHEFKCTECSESFAMQSSLMLHQSTHMKSMFTCDICNWTSKKSEYFKRHMKLMHSIGQKPAKVKGARFECPECKRTFTTIIGMKSHLHRHQLYQEDNKRTAQTRPNRIRKAVENLASNYHEASVSSIESFECFQCHKNFKTQIQCQIHINNHLPVGTRCIRCTRPLKTRDGIQSHEKTCKPITEITPTECQVCNKILPSYNHYYVHAIQDHGLAQYQVRLFQNTTCRRCGQKFKSRNEYEEHMHWHKNRPKTKEHKCNVCGKLYLDSYYYKLHVKRHAGQGLWTCDICNKSYPTFYRADHMISHTGEKKFQCSECGLMFANPFRLKRHMMTHTGEKPFECQYCLKKFRTKCRLRDHTRLHTGEFIHICKPCDKGYSDVHGLRKHNLKVHGIVWAKEKKLSEPEKQD